jgi:two-component system sensor histidine kinase HydH
MSCATTWDVLEAVATPPDVEVINDVTPFELEADPEQIAQILTNLINNAFQAMPRGGTLRIAALKDGETACITVQDSGEGIGLELVDRLFEPFFTTKSEGTGLGLAIVRRLTEAHGGEVSIANGPSQGAVVTVRIPVHAPAELLTDIK